MITDINFLYNIQYNINYSYSCSDSGCDSEGICRCAEITDWEITDINHQSVIDTIYNSFFKSDLKELSYIRNRKLINIISGVDDVIWDDIYLYSVDRLYKYFKLWNEDHYNVSIINSYYGQEVESININKNIGDKLYDELKTIQNFDSINDILEHLLILEYGHVLPILKNCNYIIENVDKSDIIFGSNKHNEKVRNKALDFYSDDNYKNIRGVVLKEDNKYRLIDGHHRVNTTKKETIKMIIAKK